MFEMQEIMKNLHEKEIIFENKISYFFKSNQERRAIFFDRERDYGKDECFHSRGFINQ